MQKIDNVKIKIKQYKRQIKYAKKTNQTLQQPYKQCKIPQNKYQKPYNKCKQPSTE